MMDQFKIIQEKYQSNETETCIQGLKLSAETIKQITSMSLKLLENNQLDLIFITEHISLLFDDFLHSLNKMINSNDSNLKFWSSTLLTHFSTITDHSKAEEILLDEVKYGNLEYAQLASTILKRAKNENLTNAISTRLLNQKDYMDDKTIDFFKEKLK